MRVPISGILTGFRIRQSGSSKDLSEYGYLDILQPGNKDFDSSLTFVVCQDTDLIQYFLQHYASGQLHWIDVLCHQVKSGRDDIWLLIKVFNMRDDPITVGDSFDRDSSAGDDRPSGTAITVSDSNIHNH